MDIQEFLLARIAEDEAVAREAAQALRGAGANWGNTFKQVEGSGHQPVADATSAWYADHIARHDPARVLSECAAKREIIKRLGPDENGNFPIRNLTIQLLMASAYSDHPDYQQKWAA